MIHYIYIPGLGDRFDPLRHLALARWKSHGSRVTLVSMRWSDKSETYEQKYARIVTAIQTHNNEKVILIGESAGGPMALLTLSRHPKQIQSTITICGYNHGASDIHPIRRRRNPAFYPLLLKTDEMLPRLPQSVRQCITTIYSTLDGTVTAKHSKIEGTQKIILRTPGHFWNIGRILIAGPKKLRPYLLE